MAETRRPRRKGTLRVAGLMSGTSGDGIDVAIVDLADDWAKGAGLLAVKLLAFDTVAFAPPLRKAIFELFDPATGSVDRICHMNFVLGEVFADALLNVARRAKIATATIDLIGSHGQTIYHMPDGWRDRGPYGQDVCGHVQHGAKKLLTSFRSTLQIAEPSVIAERTGITTVADFRPRDVAAGGQGAPLVPFADYYLFGHRRLNRAIQNIGGIANVTHLPAGGGIEDVRAFDTGPGNMIIDRLTQLATGGRKSFDAGGRMAAAGRVDSAMLAELMRHAFLRRRPPKTTGREDFGLAFSDGLFARAAAVQMPVEDLLATATAFTAASIAQAYRRFLGGKVDEVILCGGGVHNATLRNMLGEELAKTIPDRKIAVVSMDDMGLPADAKEAVSFAILAAATIRGMPNNVPSATGARKAVVMGKIVPGS